MLTLAQLTQRSSDIENKILSLKMEEYNNWKLSWRDLFLLNYLIHNQNLIEKEIKNAYKVLNWQ